MSVVLVGVPVLQDSPKFILDVGRRWNAIEHLILHAASQAPASVDELATAGALPKRVVVEALVRLMRAGWVEMTAGASKVAFNATPRGASVAVEDELPVVTERKSRKIPFVVDMITGCVFRRRDLTLLHPREWEARVEGRRACAIEKPSPPLEDLGHSASLFAALLNEEESVVRVERSDFPPSERIGVFVVRGDRIEGAPTRLSEQLKAAVLRAAKRAPTKIAEGAAPASVRIEAARTHAIRPERMTAFRRDDLVVGGDEHGTLLSSTLKRAREFAVIHSTFLSADRFGDILSDLRIAVQRGCKIDVLWGESKLDGSVAKSLTQAETIRTILRDAGLQGAVEVHPMSTRSHAKLLVADDGSGGAVATIGSCNWLYSSFNSFELSVRLRDPRLVSDTLYEVAQLAVPTTGQLTDTQARFSELGRKVSARAPITGSARVRVLIGDQHDDCVLQARDKAATKITVLSHRLGVTAKPAIIIPLGAAAKSRGVAADLFYGIASGPVAQQDAQRAKWDFTEQGVQLTAVHRPRIHAKALAWDDDNIVVSSLNWLSADTPSNNPRQEIGVSITANRIAAHLREEFANARVLAD